jgi:transcriptional antiterminator NusG
MHYFGIQVFTGAEEKFVTTVRRSKSMSGIDLVWPRRKLRIRRRGTWRDSLAPLFPGYIFLRAETVKDNVFEALRQVPRFVRFLPANDRILPLESGDLQTVTHFLSFGEVVDKSKVIFDENRRIKVISGPMMGLEGQIVKVDRRKGRARVRLELYKNSFDVDFGFEALEQSLPSTTETAVGAVQPHPPADSGTA